MAVMHRASPDWASHIPILIEVLNRTDGPVLEMGMGNFSTPLLHILCAERDRFLLSVDNDERFTDIFRNFVTNDHAIELVDFEDFDPGDSWSVVLIDHKPAERRKEDIVRFKNADFLVVHDSQPTAEDEYQYSTVFPLFKYCYTYDKFPTYTTVLSNTKEFK